MLRNVMSWNCEGALSRLADYYYMSNMQSYSNMTIWQGMKTTWLCFLAMHWYDT